MCGRFVQTPIRDAASLGFPQLVGDLLSMPASYNLAPTQRAAVVLDEYGQPLTKGQLRSRFDAAREAAGVAKGSFQFRDLRAKAGTDKADSSADIRQAQKQLGHSSVLQTESYTRKRKGEKVSPTR
jgi:integrase